MMDYKFRGKRIDNGEWVYGDVHFNPDRTKCHIHPKGERVKSFNVNPDSVGQWIGIKDNSGNGVEVFQRDIVRWSPMDFNFDDYVGLDFDEIETGEVVWCKEQARFGIRTKGQTTWGHNEFGTVEVIGNTTDNPELLV